MAQNLAALILDLEPLLSSPQKNFHKITELLQQHRELAEFEVARFWVAHSLEQAAGDVKLDAVLADVDPRERVRGIAAVEMMLGRAAAAKALRHLVKDPDPRVRTAARRVAGKLQLSDVALPDNRVTTQVRGVGAWNWTGWSFGILKHQLGWHAAPRQPSRFPTLAQRGLPALADAAAVAAFLGVDGGEEGLARLMRPGVGAGSPYVEFEIAKAKSGVRRISAPRAALRTVQRKILDDILGKVAMHDASHGFVRGRSTVTNARPHARAKIVVKTDLKDFFPTIHFRRVQGIFEWLGYGAPVAALLASLTTHRPQLADGTVIWPGVLPQGAPTSPALANLACRRLDARLTGVAKRAGATYTRYADDLTFSFMAEPTGGVGRFLWWVDQICQQEGFAEHPGKRRVMRPGNQQRVTGLVVNEAPHVPREARRRFRAILTNCKKHGVDAQARGRDDFRDYLRGFAAYVSMVQPALGAKLTAEVAALLGGKP